MAINAIPAVHLAMFPNLLIFFTIPDGGSMLPSLLASLSSQLIMYSDFMSSSESKSPVSTGVD
jgi:hypothetical protein